MEMPILLVSQDVFVWIPLVFAAIALLAASITDLKTREVPDMLNYGLIVFGISLNAFLSAFYWDLIYLLNSVLGLLLCFGIGWMMFYAGQWGGGDSKMLMGLGALIGIPIAWGDSFLLSLLLNILFAGAVYGLAWSMYLVFRDWRRFKGHYLRICRSRPIWKMRMLAYLFAALSFIAILLLDYLFVPTLSLLPLPFIVLLIPFFYLFAKSIERSSMLVNFPISRLTEGEWIAKDVIVKGKRVCGPKDLGISKAQIRELKRLQEKGLIQKVLVKQGIPFIPSFLIAFLFTIAIGNPFLFILGMF